MRGYKIAVNIVFIVNNLADFDRNDITKPMSVGY